MVEFIELVGRWVVFSILVSIAYKCFANGIAELKKDDA